MRFLDNSPRGPKNVGFLLQIFGGEWGLTATVHVVWFLFLLITCLSSCAPDIFTPVCLVVNEMYNLSSNSKTLLNVNTV
jgi:hypothetical protein